MTTGSEWIGSRALKGLLEKQFGSDTFDGEAQLRDGLRTGHISAKAKSVLIEGVDGRTEEQADWAIPASLWREPTGLLELGSDRYYVESNSLDRRVNIDDLLNPAVTGRKTTFRCMRLLFDKGDVHECLDLETATSHPVSDDSKMAVREKPKGGRKAAPGWPHFAAALAVWVQRKNDPASDIAMLGPDTVFAEVDKILTTEWGIDGLARSTFQPATQEFIQRMKDEGAAGR